MVCENGCARMGVRGWVCEDGARGWPMVCGDEDLFLECCVVLCCVQLCCVVLLAARRDIIFCVRVGFR